MTYCRLSNFSLFYKYYCYIDTNNYSIESVLRTKNINMSFIIFREMSREDDDTFHLMFAKIKRKDIKRFEEEVLPELHKKLLIEYGNKYTKMCQMLEKIKQDAHKMRENRDKGLDNNDKDI